MLTIYLSLFSNIVPVISSLFFTSEILNVLGTNLSFSLIVSLIFYNYTIFLLIKLLLYLPLVELLSFINKKIQNIFFIICETLFSLFIFLDSTIFKSQGLHLYDKSVVLLLRNPDLNREFGIDLSMVLSITAVFILLFLAHHYMITFLQKRVPSNIVTKSFFIITFCGLGAFVSYHTFILRHTKATPLFHLANFIHGQHKQSPLKSSFPLIKKERLSKTTPVFLVLAESLRFSMLKYMPSFNKYIQNNNCYSFEKAYSASHVTDTSFFSIMYGINGYNYKNFSDAHIKSFGLQTLKNNGYKILGSSASTLKGLHSGTEFILQQFTDYQEFKSHVLENDDINMLRWVEKNNLSQVESLFNFIFFYSTHNPYIFPKEFEKFKPTTERTLTQMLSDNKKKLNGSSIFNRYKNSVGFLDYLLSSTIAKIEQRNNKNFILIFAGDHGEEFWEHGFHGHAKPSFIEQRVHIPLVFCIPTGQHLKANKKSIVSQVDIFPTILSLLGAKNSTLKTYFQGLPLTTKVSKKRSHVIVTSGGFPYRQNKLALITPNDKIWLKKNGEKVEDVFPYSITDLDDKPIIQKSLAKKVKFVVDEYKKQVYKFLSTKKQRPSTDNSH